MLKTIQKRAEKKYSDYLVAVLEEELDTFFPLYLLFPKVRANAPILELDKWVSELKNHSKDKKGFGYQLEMNRIRSRTNNFQTLPTKLFFPTEQDYLKFIGKQKTTKDFLEQSSYVLQKVPLLRPWILEKPLRFLKYANKWEDLVKVILFYQDNPRPNLYPRELPIEVHSKFVETHKGIIEQLLEELSIKEKMDWDRKTSFERLALKRPPSWIRMRFLDPELTKQLGFPFQEVALPTYSFQELTFEPRIRVFVIENQVTFLTFPPVKNGMAIWGKGYSVKEIKGKNLENSQIWYWGDLDAQGFHILSIFRKNYPQVHSFLMDQLTYDKFQIYVVRGKAFQGDIPPNLSLEEKEMCQKLMENNLRLEQEHISQHWVIAQGLKKEF